MALVQVEGPGPAGRTVDARTARRALRAEKAQLLHWRRLLRARLDLAVAGLAPPEPLGTLTWDLVPEAAGHLPRPDELTAAVSVPTPEDTVELMNHLRQLDRALSQYAGAVDRALEHTTASLLRAQADDGAPPPLEA